MPQRTVQTKEEKILGVDTCRELEAMALGSLNEAVASASEVIRATKEELEANPKYQELKESLKALTAGFSEVKKRQNAKIQYALKLREGK